MSISLRGPGDDPGMKRFLDLADFEREPRSSIFCRSPNPSRRWPQRRALAGKVLGLLFMNPSLRTLASFQTAMAHLGGSSFVITPGQGTWQLETRRNAVMDGAAAEHIREGIPVLASYCDALGVRAFAEGKNLAERSAESLFRQIDALCDAPLINLESAVNHPCQALADWRTLDELKVAPRAKIRALLGLSPAGAAARGARRRRCTWRRCAAWRWWWRGPKGSPCRVQIMDKARARRAGLGRLGERDRGPAGGARRRARALCQGMGQHRALRRRRGRCEAARRPQGLVRTGGLVLAAHPDATFMHCLPVRRNVAVADEMLDGPRAAVRLRGTQSPGRPDGGAAPHAGRQPVRAFAEYPSMIMSRPDPSIAVRALKSAAPYIRMYKNKVFVIKAGGAVFNDEASMRGLIEQVAILHQVGIKTVLVHGGGPQLDQLQAMLGIETRMVNGRRVTDQKSIDVTSMVLNGLINTRILAICRALDIEAIGLSGVDSGSRSARTGAGRSRSLPAQARPSITASSATSIRSTSSVFEKLLANGLMPVVSPLSADSSGTLLNINADTVAAAIGGALSAEKLVLCTGAPGILERSTDPSSLISYTDIKGLAAPARRRQPHGRHAAQGHGDRERNSRRRAPRARDLLQVARQPARGDLHQRRHRHPGGRGSQGLEPGRADGGPA